jgi:hypothetical protein
MALNPFREALSQAGSSAFHHESAFKSEADAAFAGFQTLRDDLERQVRRGDVTLKVAREKSQAAAKQLKEHLTRKAEAYSPVPRVFLDRLIEANNQRKRTRDHLSIEGLQRETNRLIRQSLIEQQLQNRAREFEGKTFERTLIGGQPAPSLNSLLSFHETAALGGDDAAREWARRQLEAMRPRVLDPADLRRLDLACDRPDTVNPRLVAGYIKALPEADHEAMELFVAQAIDDRDANACVAAFLLAREAPAGVSVRWVRNVLSSLTSFPDAALATLRTLEAEARASDSDDARAQAEYAIALAEAQTRFDGVEPPSDDDLARQARLRAKPVADLGQSIGLALDRRGAYPEERLENPSE